MLSNLHMRRFLLGWKQLGHQYRLNGHIVNYADDFVICCRGTASQSMKVMRGMMDRLGLTVNEDKTQLRRLPDGSFDFLGHTIGRCHIQLAFCGVRRQAPPRARRARSGAFPRDKPGGAPD
ncbi:MAG: hypothetical protein OXG98_05975 [Gemmatimonadetes bacterium]|nr:hypothetical protein [Gemmatimonadota bacterium]